MYPSSFDYHRPTDLDRAIDLIADDHGAELLAGGHSLLPMLKTGLADVDNLIDIGRIDAIQGVQIDNDHVTVGSGTVYSDLLAHDAVHSNLPHLVAAVREIGDRQVRNSGTIGGNIAHADPAADLPGVVLASQATLVAKGPQGKREIDAKDFFTGMFETTLGEDEILTAVRFPSLSEDEVGVYEKLENPASGYAVIGVAIVTSFVNDQVSNISIGVNGAFDRPRRLRKVEESLQGSELTSEVITDLIETAVNCIDQSEFLDDDYASPDYRKELLRAYTREGLMKVSERTNLD